MQLLQLWVNSAKPSTVPVLVVFPHQHFPYTLVGSNDMHLLHLVFCSWTESHQVSLNDIFMRISTKHNSTTRGWIDDPSHMLISWHAMNSNGLSLPCLHGRVIFIVHPITLVLFNLDIAIIKYDYFTKTTCLSLSMEKFKDHNYWKCRILGESY